MSLETIIGLVADYGLWLIFLLAVIEGPIVTVIAAYVVALGKLDLYAVYAVLVASDLVGDMIYYAVGRSGQSWMPARWRRRIGLTDERMASLSEHFAGHGGKTLVIGKLTHSAGVFILIGAGASKMAVGRFLLFNLIGTLPKTLFFMAIGYSMGFAYQQIDSYIFRASLVVFVLMAVAALIWVLRRRGRAE